MLLGRGRPAGRDVSMLSPDSQSYKAVNDASGRLALYSTNMKHLLALLVAGGPIALGLLFWPAATAGAAPPRVELEVLIDQGASNTSAPTWSQLLSQAGFSSVRLKSGNGEEPTLRTAGTDSAPVYRVVGVLTTNNQLLLPKGRFSVNDRSAIERWLAKLREGGEDGLFIKPVSFGLLPKQLVAVHEALAAPVSFATSGKRPREVARQIAAALPYKFVTDSTCQQALAAGEPLTEELQGLSSGTALAALLHPLGLVMLPEKTGNDISLRIRAAAAGGEHWPVGWPPKTNPSETLPGLFKFLTVEIDSTPLTEAITAISGRVNAPVLIDHVALARQRVDLGTKVSFPKASTFYGRALDRLLAQAKLKYDVRVDEANKPFLWITALIP